MTKEELFLAIGQVEESRLSRTELSVQEPSPEQKEEPVMKKKRVTLGRVIRNLLVAAAIISMLGVTAYAAAAYLIFDSPEEMVTAVFGDQTGFDHKGVTTWSDPEKPGSLYEVPGYDRVPADEAVVQQEAAPLVEPVQQSISWNGYTLTIDANLYDHATKCGLVTYILENPNGLGYSIQNDGSVWFPGGEIMGFSQYGYSYIIQDQSNDTKLTATYYYQLRDAETTDLTIGFTQWASRTMEEEKQRIEEIKKELRQEITEEEALAYRKMSVGDQWPWFEENRTREENIESAYEEMAYLRLEDADACPDKILITESEQSEMSSVTVGNGAVTISPIAMTLRIQEIENLPEERITMVKIRFADGTEYVVVDENTLNHVFWVGDEKNMENTLMFNRIIDVNEVTSVIVDGNIELTVD